jgi:DNA (cytosine-5)-methyltransferase 1
MTMCILSSLVREWARIQTFPDWYKFAGKRTTGGIRRAKVTLTAIGNAVPVRLALHFDMTSGG